MALSGASVRNVLRRYRPGPAPRASGPSWDQFLRAQAPGTLACDSSHAGTVMLRRLYVLFFIDLGRREVPLAGATAHPVGTWVTQQARDLVIKLEDKGRTVRSLARDRDAKSVGPSDEVLRSIGARAALTPVRSPRADAFAERSVRTARAECTDWLLIRGERHLDRVLGESVEHYNNERPHRGTDLEAPVAHTTFGELTKVDRAQRADRTGGLVHGYRVAA